MSDLSPLRPLKWGVLGASRFAQRFMAPALHGAAHSELYALATASPEKASGFRALCPGLIVHPSYQALLADPQVDAVYIPLPNHLHVKWTLAALAAGKHVLCEKPMALRAADYDALIAARDASVKLAAEAFMIVHNPQWHLTRRLLDEGQIGALRHADVVFTYDLPDPTDIRNQATTGGGSIPDIGVYAYGAVRYAARAEPLELRAVLRRENGVDTYAHVLGELSGPHGPFSYSAITSMRLFPRQEVTFQGTQGEIKLTCPFNADVAGQAEVRLRRHDAPEQLTRFPGSSQYIRQVERFIEHVRGGAAFPWTLEDARGTQAMIDAVFASELR